MEDSVTLRVKERSMVQDDIRTGRGYVLGFAAVAIMPLLIASGGGASPESQPIFGSGADARAQIEAAVARAKRQHRRVLVVFGADWCPWCRKLHKLFRENRDIASLLKHEYEVVLVDVGRRDRNMDIAERYHVDLKKNGIPFLTVLDEQGEVIVNQETGALEEGERHSPQKVAEFLNRWKLTSPPAVQVLGDVLLQARAGHKLAFVSFSAPWCAWCDLLEDFLVRPEVARILEKDYVHAVIDIRRMEGGEAIYRLYGSQAGATILPWYVILNAEGKVLCAGDGFPVTPEKRERFYRMIASTARRAKAEDLARLRELLEQTSSKR